MIFLRFKQTFRERLGEWITSIGMVMWGSILLLEPLDIITASYFAVLTNIMAIWWWGALAIGAGLARLSFLAVNGYWRPSAHLRAIGAIFGTLLWGSLALSYLTLPWTPPAVAAKAMLFAMDISALWYAAADAKLADIAARERKAVYGR